jgi:hypothetical protein
MDNINHLDRDVLEPTPEHLLGQEALDLLNDFKLEKVESSTDQGAQGASCIGCS